ncbi:hypothetical protein QTP88_004480 [Uroleucon formosanum]
MSKLKTYNIKGRYWGENFKNQIISNLDFQCYLISNSLSLIIILWSPRLTAIDSTIFNRGRQEIMTTIASQKTTGNKLSTPMEWPAHYQCPVVEKCKILINPPSMYIVLVQLITHSSFTQCKF